MSVRQGFADEVAGRVRSGMAKWGGRTVVEVIGDEHGKAALAAVLTPDELRCVAFTHPEESARQAWESLSRDVRSLFEDEQVDRVTGGQA